MDGQPQLAGPPAEGGPGPVPHDEPGAHRDRADGERREILRHLLQAAEGPDHLSDGPGQRLREQHRGGPAPVPAVGERQEANPHVHQLPRGQCHRRPGHIRHHAVRPATHQHLVCGAGLQYGFSPPCCWDSGNAPLFAKFQVRASKFVKQGTWKCVDKLLLLPIIGVE